MSYSSRPVLRHPTMQKIYWVHLTMVCISLSSSACQPEPDSIHHLSTLPKTTEIIGDAIPIPGFILQAVGALISPTSGQFCTATLVAPDRVVTARHCHDNVELNTLFVTGHDAYNPQQAYRVLGTLADSSTGGGAFDLGLDVAVMILEEPISGIEPITIRNFAHRSSDVFGFIGYGDRKHPSDMYTPPDMYTRPPNGQKFGGLVKMVALGGNHAQNLFGEDYAAFEDLARALNQDPDELWSHSNLLPEDQATFLFIHNATGCSGDSGGPLLQYTRYGWSVYGVNTGGFSCTDGRVDGQVITVFGPQSMPLLSEWEHQPAPDAPPICQCHDVDPYSMECHIPAPGQWQTIIHNCEYPTEVCIQQTPEASAQCVIAQ